MSDDGTQRRRGPSRALRAFVAALVVAFLVPVVLLVVASFASIGRTAMDVVFVATFVLVATMLVRALLLLLADRRSDR